MSRIGKIARLSQPIREQLNRRLEDGDRGRDILQWVNSLDETRRRLSPLFTQWEITDRNLTEWRQGGFRDWRDHQTALFQMDAVMTEGQELAKKAEGNLSAPLAAWLMGRYLAASRRITEQADDTKSWELLRQFAKDILALRRSDLAQERVRIARDRLKLEQRKSGLPDDSKPRRQLTPKQRQAIVKQILGITDNPRKPDPPPAKRPESPQPAKTAPPPAPPAAKSEFETATEQAARGDPMGEYRLAELYRNGIAVAKDLDKARQWMRLAASHGVAPAKEALSALAESEPPSPPQPSPPPENPT